MRSEADKLIPSYVPYERLINWEELALPDVSAGSRLLGRGDSGAGAIQEITLGSNLTMTGTTLSASGGGGQPSDVFLLMGG